ncbi:uncharacterized protein K441DRAFT_708216 [Cenococcum geophilum 1.58]|uniref:uncharacterized protein n=1 Tax=Cenococcum geophilum 1.58 TaxID=794803 RepID=UPI00358EC44B|nr:hypothetical protein K441DRAFT_708216 [Cenococcum geophilum 1.58]
MNVKQYQAERPIITATEISGCSTIVWSCRGPTLPGYKRVFRTGNLRVDQFYSGTALSALLAPAAMLLRKLSNDFMSLHPFAIAARRPVRIGDLDRMMDAQGGPFVVAALTKYSAWNGIMQTVLMCAGWMLVPIGTLMLTTGSYAPQTPGSSVVGLPTMAGGVNVLSSSMAYSDTFLTLVGSAFKGSLISQSGTFNPSSGTLGPISTANISFETGVRYEGLITYQWAANCEPARGDISYTKLPDNSTVLFTFPDGSVQPDDTLGNSEVFGLNIFFWSNATNGAVSGIPMGGTTFFALNSDKQANNAIPVTATADNGLDFIDGEWISRIKCTPSLDWQISTCIFNGSAMQNCISTPNANTTSLDLIGLDALNSYMTAVPWFFWNSYDLAIAEPLVALYNALSVTQYENILGAVAQSIAAIASAGYYGTAVVPTVGEAPKEVYIARVYIMWIVLLILVAVIAFSVADIVYCLVYHLPFRRTTFLTIANAVRGPWWDQELHGGCVLRDARLRRMGTAEVMFGVDAENLRHVGFAPTIVPIKRDEAYFGLGGSKLKIA